MKFLIVGFLTFTMTAAAVGPVQAHVRTSQVAAEGAMAWRGDGRCYMVRQGRWVPTAYTRVFPIRGNGWVFDVAQNGRYLKRVDLSQRGWVYELDVALQNAAYTWRRYAIRRPNDTVEYLVPAANRWVTPEVVLTNLIAQLNALVSQARTQTVPQTRVSANSDAIQAQIMAINNASNYNMIKIWTAPNCTASYDGC